MLTDKNAPRDPDAWLDYVRALWAAYDSEQRQGISDPAKQWNLALAVGALLKRLDAGAADLKTRTEEREEARDWVRRITTAARVLTCAFCGEAYPPGTPTDNHEALTAHVRVCAKHPMREVERERDEMRKLLSRLRVELLATGALSEYSARSIAREIDAALAAGARR